MNGHPGARHTVYGQSPQRVQTVPIPAHSIAAASWASTEYLRRFSEKIPKIRTVPHTARVLRGASDASGECTKNVIFDRDEFCLIATFYVAVPRAHPYTCVLMISVEHETDGGRTRHG